MVVALGEPAATGDGFCCELPTDPAPLRAARRDIRDWAADAGLPPGRLDDVVFAVDEAVVGLIGRSPGAPGRVWIDGHVALGQVRIVVTDHVPHPDGPPTDLQLIDGLADHRHVEQLDGACAITMVWDINPARLSEPRRGSETA
jgi:hypothetical protein